MKKTEEQSNIRNIIKKTNYIYCAINSICTQRFFISFINNIYAKQESIIKSFYFFNYIFVFWCLSMPKKNKRIRFIIKLTLIRNKQ
jgi:hypothetical protein